MSADRSSRTPYRPEVVGPNGEDVSDVADRAILVRALDAALRTHEEVRTLRAGLKLEADATKGRIADLERKVGSLSLVRDPFPSRPRPVSTEDDDEPETGSYHEIQELFGQAGAEVYARMKDPNSKFDSARARAIAQEVLQQARSEAELTTWRRIKGVLPTVGMATLKALGPFIAGGLVWEILRVVARLR